MIIVHDGKAHHDDFLATCVLMYKLNARAIRTKFTEEHLNDPEFWVIDQGASHNPELHNFDHHHIKQEICAFTMVLDHFYGKEYRKSIPQLRFVEIFDSYGPKGAAKFCNTTEDVLEISASPISEAIIGVFSNIVGEVNDPLYSVMKQMGKVICEKIENTDKLLSMIKNGVAVMDYDGLKVLNVINCKIEEGFGHENLPTKLYCKLNDIQADVILSVDTRNGGYRMISNNTDIVKFTQTNESYFCHNSGFLICFKNLNDYKPIVSKAFNLRKQRIIDQ